MKPSNTENQFAIIAATFCLIGLALLLSVMIWHQQINRHPLFKKNVTAVAVPELQVASVTPVTLPTAVVPSASTVPESVIQAITTDPRNLVGTAQPAEELPPAMKFLYTLKSSPDIFPTQR